MFDEPFTLDPTPQRAPRKPEVLPGEKLRQTVLFAGLDCLPGQRDLFATDGQHETESQR